MRRFVVSIFTAGLILASSSFPGYGCGEYPVRTYRSQDGTEYALYLPKRISKTPKWSPKAGDPPLGISQLWNLAEKWAKKKYARYDRVAVQSVSLQSTYSCDSGEKRWYYIVEFTPYIDGNALHGSGNVAAVLMDGTIVAPRRWKRGSKHDMPFPHPPLPKL